MENKLTAINRITDDLHDVVASINEELVDENYEEVRVLIETMRIRLKTLETNITNDEI